MWTPTTGPTMVSTEHTLSLPWGPRGTWHPTPGRASPQDVATDPGLDFWSLAARAALPGPTVEKYLPCARAGACPVDSSCVADTMNAPRRPRALGPSQADQYAGQAVHMKVCGSSQDRAERVSAGSPGRDRVLQPEPVLPKARPQEDRALVRTARSSGEACGFRVLCMWIQNVLTEQEDEIKFWIFCFQLNDFVSQFSHLQEAWGKQPKGLAKTKRRMPPTWGPRKGRTSASAAGSPTRS